MLFDSLLSKLGRSSGTSRAWWRQPRSSSRLLLPRSRKSAARGSPGSPGSPRSAPTCPTRLRPCRAPGDAGGPRKAQHRLRRFETSGQTLRRVPQTFFDAYFSGRYAQDVCADVSIFVVTSSSESRRRTPDARRSPTDTQIPMCYARNSTAAKRKAPDVQRVTNDSRHVHSSRDVPLFA
jgi:hypothetical protein